jgi:integrase
MQRSVFVSHADRTGKVIMSGKKDRRQFGYVRRLPSKRWHASYTGPDLVRHAAPFTFDAKMDAEAWLAAERKIIEGGNWIAPKKRKAAIEAMLPPTFGDYAAGWLRSRSLKPRTRHHYQQILDRQLPHLVKLRLTEITPTVVREWYTDLGPGTPTLRAHAYGLLRTILGSAVSEQIIPFNPCVMRGAGSARTTHRPKPATLIEIATIAQHMPDRLQLAVLLAAWCGLRFGELIELRRSDIDQVSRVIHVRRAAYRVPGNQVAIGKPKSDAGIRDVSIPPHLLPEIKRHLGAMKFGRDALLFPGAKGGHLAPSALYRHFYPARKAAGRPDLRWHDLRHTGATLAAATGASLAELMARLGHSTAAAAMRYQHAVSDRDRVIAEALSKMAEGV